MLRPAVPCPFVRRSVARLASGVRVIAQAAPPVPSALLVVSAALLASSFAVADEVFLQNGQRLLGKAFREPGIVQVELDSGATVGFPEDFVTRIVPGISPAEAREARRAERRRELESRIETAGLADPQALYRVAGWARDSKHEDENVAYVLGLVLGADPDHAAARADLGQVRYRTQWVERDAARTLELRDHAAAMRARGFVEFRGAWMTPEEADWSAEIDGLLGELAALERDNNELRDLLERATRKVQNARADAERLQAEAAGFRAEANRLRGEADAYRSDAERFRAEAADWESRAHSIQCDLDSALSERNACLSSRIDPSDCDCPSCD